MIKCLIVAAVMAAFSFSTATAGRDVNIVELSRTAKGWQIIMVPETNKCMAMKFDGDNSLNLSIFKDGTADIYIGNLGWKFERGRTASFRVVTDHNSGTYIGVVAPSQNHIIFSNVNEDSVLAFAEHNMIMFYIEGTRVFSFDLDGSYEALEQLVECVGYLRK